MTVEISAVFQELYRYCTLSTVRLATNVVLVLAPVRSRMFSPVQVLAFRVSLEMLKGSFRLVRKNHTGTVPSGCRKFLKWEASTVLYRYRRERTRRTEQY
jgi:hypothetical protein